LQLKERAVHFAGHVACDCQMPVETMAADGKFWEVPGSALRAAQRRRATV